MGPCRGDKGCLVAVNAPFSGVRLAQETEMEAWSGRDGPWPRPHPFPKAGTHPCSLCRKPFGLCRPWQVLGLSNDPGLWLQSSLSLCTSWASAPERGLHMKLLAPMRPLMDILPRLYLLTTNLSLIQTRGQRFKEKRDSSGPLGECSRLKAGHSVLKTA